MKLALVGSGSIAADHARAVATLAGTAEGRDLRIAAVVGRRPEQTAEFARAHGIPLATTDLGAVLADGEIDIVLVASPTDRHAGQTEAALQAGKHVLCEIPLATSLAETDALVALADGQGRRLGVCHTLRFRPALREARRRVEAGELRPLSVAARHGFLRRENVNWRGRRRSWTDNLLWHHGAHAVDAALWLLGADLGEGPVEVAAQVAPPGPDLGIPMDIALALRTPAGRVASVSLSYSTAIPVHDYLLAGEETTLLATPDELRDPSRPLVSPSDDSASAALLAQDAAFFAAVRDGRDPEVSARSVRATMAVLEAAQATVGRSRP